MERDPQDRAKPGISQTFQPLSSRNTRSTSMTLVRAVISNPRSVILTHTRGVPQKGLQGSSSGRSQGYTSSSQRPNNPSRSTSRNYGGSGYPQNSNPLENLWRDSSQSLTQRPPDRPIGVVSGYNAPDVEREQKQAEYEAWQAKVNQKKIRREDYNNTLEDLNLTFISTLSFS